MQKIGRLGLGGVAVLLAACGGKGVGSVGNVHGGEEAGGTAGSSGSGVDLPGGGGSCEGCERVAPADNILNFAANDQAVYWIERGTNNEFQEYNVNGALLARDLDSGKVSTLAGGLDRPAYLGVSARYAYVFLNEKDVPLMLRRYPLDSVDATAGEEVASYTGGQTFSTGVAAFAATQDFSYFILGKRLHRIAETPGAEEELVLPDAEIEEIITDGTRVYFGSDSLGLPGLYTIDALGAAPTYVTDTPPGGLAYPSVVDGHFYGVEEARYATRLLAVGGEWKRFADKSYGGLQVLGDYFYVIEERNEEDRAVITRGALSAPADRTELASYEHHSGPLNWLATRTGVYWATDAAVQFVPSR